MERFIHQRPKEQNPELPSLHSIDLAVEGKNVGQALIEYHSKPMPLYYIGNIHIDEEERGKRYGSELMENIEKMLREKGKPGILMDGIEILNPDSSAIGMYERRGWTRIPETPFLVYNLPTGASPEDLETFFARKNRPDRIARLENRYNEE